MPSRGEREGDVSEAASSYAASAAVNACKLCSNNSLYDYLYSLVVLCLYIFVYLTFCNYEKSEEITYQ